MCPEGYYTTNNHSEGGEMKPKEVPIINIRKYRDFHFSVGLQSQPQFLYSTLLFHGNFGSGISKLHSGGREVILLFL